MTVGDDFPKEQARVRELLGLYKEIGPSGVFGAAMIEQVLRRADAAAISGDVVAILRSYEELKGCVVNAALVPVAVAKDVLTLGGAMTGKRESYTREQIETLKDEAQED